MSTTFLLSLPNMETWTTERFLLEAKVGGEQWSHWGYTL